MYLEYLHEFAVLAESESFAAAADALFLSQAAMSRHIRNMEEELGVSLFYRTSRCVQLSRYGRLLLPYAKTMSALHGACLTDLEKLHRQMSGNLTIGVLPTGAYYGVTEMLAAFKMAYPKIEIQLTNGDGPVLRQRLCDGECDYAFVRETSLQGRSGYECYPYTTDDLVAVLPEAHPLSAARSLKLTQLAKEKFILLPEHTATYRTAILACRKAGFEPQRVFSGTTGRGIFELVSHNLCVALLTRKPAESMLVPGTVLVNIEPAVPTYINLIYMPALLMREKQSLLRFVQARGRS